MFCSVFCTRFQTNDSMSFQIIDSDEIPVFSSSPSSPAVHSAAPMFSNLEFVAKDDTAGQTNSTPLDGSLYQTMSTSNFVLKDDKSKVEQSVNETTLDGRVWTLSDFITTTISSSQSPLLPFESVAPIDASHSISVSMSTSGTSFVPVTVSLSTSGTSSVPVTVSWSTLGTSCVPLTVSWSTLGTNSAPVNVDYSALRNTSAQAGSLGSNNNILQQDNVQFSDTYERVSFDGPHLQESNLFAQASPQDGKKAFDLSPLPSESRSQEQNLGGIQNINNQCYEAAISEHFGRKKHSKIGQYVSKVKNSKPHSGLSQVYDKLQRVSPGQSPVHRIKQKTDFSKSPITSPAAVKETASEDSNVTKSTFSTFTMPSIPSPSSPFSARSHSPIQADGQKSPKSPKGETDIKKYRYNQTALALQQSGLMKTTIKTAELLRKSRLLQQELSKLRKETAVFVHMVLNNPENKHIKDMYMPEQEDNSKPQ
ncbi:uncharacterized protein LOC123539592 [Mercenaria mercenaria]|uniref:uncharacterized protein LOC123539592 n=1 Tax=Mercenaria mercenaria TaxID=6596 RepID=UPI00234EB03C|nr:uncharacterized protein LOC123539592 [Mercenaria mercenaria]